MVMPAVLPSCAVFYEEGCSYIDGNYNKKILSMSPLGIMWYGHQNLLNNMRYPNSPKAH